MGPGLFSQHLQRPGSHVQCVVNPTLTFQSIPSSKATVQRGLATDWSCSNLSDTEQEGGSQGTLLRVTRMLAPAA